MATAPSAAPNARDWMPTASGTALLRLSPSRTNATDALRMDYVFHAGGGFAVARRAFPRAMPEDYALRFRLRGRGSAPRLEIKLIDETGQNVWRHTIDLPRPPFRWKRFRIDGSRFDFAWGPANGSKLTRLGFLEFAIVASSEGSGTLWLADAEVEDCTPMHPPTARASSSQQGFEAAGALGMPGWKPASEDSRPWLLVDCIERRVIGGLTLDWLDEAPAGGFRVQISFSGRRWKTVYAAVKAGGSRSYVYLPQLRTRYLRLGLRSPNTGLILHLQPFDFSRSIDAFWSNIAAASPRGWHPRWLHREQSLWTPIGTSDGDHCALINEDGMVEPTPGSYSLEPLLWVGERLYAWSDLLPRPALSAGYLPIPSVTWETPDWQLTVTAESIPGGSLRVHYRLQNRRGEALAVRLYLAIRPFQVTPPWQHFRELGGVHRIRRLAWHDQAVEIDAGQLIVPETAPSGFGAACFDEGGISRYLAAGKLPASSVVSDSFGFASGALEFALALPASGNATCTVHCRTDGSRDSKEIPAFDWRSRMPAAMWSGNGWIGEAVAAALTATAHILITRCGPALRPGPRRYSRSWIRDGTMMSAALLRMGHVDEVRQFIRWYAPNQRADGFVPCCVDGDGIDWLVEHDSHGQLISLIADHQRFAPDPAFLREQWPCVERAVGFISRSLGSDGLLPISVSHEGYLAQPVHSYWDDFWALRGVRDAQVLAQRMGKTALAQEWEALSDRLGSAVSASVRNTRVSRDVDYIPGSVEWADFDPTATANAVYLLGAPAGLDRAALDRTFDKYLLDWRNKRRGTTPSTNYTPYEIRIIGALVRLDRRLDALELLRFFLSDRRPPAWNQWPEIAWLDRTSPAHLGDLPHTWIGAEYVLAVRSLFAYEDEATGRLVIAAGLDPEWIDGSGVTVEKMPTSNGTLSYSLRRLDIRTLECRIDGTIDAEVVLRPPLPGPLTGVQVDGAPHREFDERSVTLAQIPASVVCIASPADLNAAA